MKMSEFQRAVTDEFGRDYGQVLVRDFVIEELNAQTAEEALAGGESVRTVWFALCSAMDVPVRCWRGAGKPEPRHV
jgi:hypothetical protein